MIADESPIDNFRKFDPVAPSGWTSYAFAQFVVTVAVGTKVLMMASSLSIPETAAIVFYLALSLTNIGGLLEGERWSLLLEFARLLSLAAAGITLLLTTGVSRLPVIMALAWLAVSALWLRNLAGRIEPGTR